MTFDEVKERAGRFEMPILFACDTKCRSMEKIVGCPAVGFFQLQIIENKCVIVMAIKCNEL